MATSAHDACTTLDTRQGRFRAIGDISNRLIRGNGEALAAWGIWAFLSLAGLCFVAIYGLRTPFVDEWEWIGQATGNLPVTFSWLWSQHNEHRMFLPRLIYLGLGYISGFDFRAGCFFSMCILSGLSFALMKAARAVRGKTVLADAFFPLILLHWGQYENLIWGFQLNFVTSVVLEGVILLLIMRTGNQATVKGSDKASRSHNALTPCPFPDQPSVGAVAVEAASCRFMSNEVIMPQLNNAARCRVYSGREQLRQFLPAAICICLLGLCGTYSVVFLPPLACWLMYISLCKWRSGERHAKWIAIFMSLLAAMPAALFVFYLHGLYTCAANPGFYPWARTTIQFISHGIGPAAREIWPISGVMAIAACAIIVRQFWCSFRNQSNDRARAVGFLMFFAGIMALGLAIGLGRSTIGPMAGFEARYMTLAVPFVLLLFVQSLVHGSPAFRYHVPRVLFILMGVLFVVNTQKGISYTVNLWEHLEEFDQDIRDGFLPNALGVRYAEQWGHVPPEIFTARLDWLRKARLGPYASSTSKAGEMVHVESIGWRPRSAEKVESVRLGPGQSFTHHFTVNADGELCRIDFQIDIGRTGRLFKRLDWEIFKLGSDGNEDLAARDSIDPNRVTSNIYASIPVDHLPVNKSKQYVLILKAPADSPADAFVTIAVSQATGNLKAFAYLNIGNPAVQIMAQRIEQGKQ